MIRALVALAILALIVALRRRRDDQSWYWTDEWQAGERESKADIAAGRVERYDTVDDFIRSLERDNDATWSSGVTWAGGTW